MRVTIETLVSPRKPDRILGGPAPGLRVVVPGSESDEPCLMVVEAARKPEGLFDDARRDFGLKPLVRLRLSSPRAVDRPDACLSKSRSATMANYADLVTRPSPDLTVVAATEHGNANDDLII